MIHAAIMGSIERFMSTMIEHVAGSFPLWLSPTQVTIVPIRDEHEETAYELLKKFQAKDIRATVDAGKDSMGKRIREAKTKKVPYVIIIGDQEKASGLLTVETRGEKIEGITSADFIARIEKEIKEKTLN